MNAMLAACRARTSASCWRPRRACFEPLCSSVCRSHAGAAVGQIANFYWLASGHTPQLARFPDDDTYWVLTLLGLIG